MKIAGLLLAAGAGHRMGTPKALIRDPSGVAWVVGASRLLTSAGCSPVVVVVGASAEQVAAELDASVEVIEATNWQEGMGASLRAGLAALKHHPDPQPGTAGTHHPHLSLSPSVPGPSAALIVPVDVPGLTADVLQRVSAHAGRSALVRAVYKGSPGHPVLIGRDHWDGVIATAVGDQGARAYLKQHPPVEVECGDLADGMDVDTVEDLPEGHRPG
ncbi:NTP transferase domain-containing protein [Kribbella sp. NPDC049174]|uniref:nucleotidyltransferase family protein n=1 Tax=Kribbella sp. NPDC049174 TaxID=3364112 RepID=UPI0037168F4A